VWPPITELQKSSLGTSFIATCTIAQERDSRQCLDQQPRLETPYRVSFSSNATQVFTPVYYAYQ
jgi:hypothetical protein